MVNIIQECRVSPQHSAVPEQTLPVTFFDIFWLNFHQVERLLFYKLPAVTKSSYIDTLIPKLKTSLSIVLQHYLPLAGNAVCPSEDSGVPVLRYMSGDSVPVVFAESSSEEDFDRLAGNQPRNCDDFYLLIPELPPSYVSAKSKIIPLFAVQVTLFPNSGISIGITNQHAIGDASVIVGFMQAWASVNKLEGDSHLKECNLLPFYDRTVIKDPYHLTTKYLKRSWQESWDLVSDIRANKVRATFVLRQNQIQALKNYVITKRPELTHVSSFTVTCAYIWTSWLKAKHAVEDRTTTATNEAVEYLVFSVDCRSRLDPPIPPEYFGNCLVACCPHLTHEELVSKDGFLLASEKIGTALHEQVNDKVGIINGSLSSKLAAIDFKRTTGVAGTTKKDIYEADFGWGKPEKFEIISIDNDESMSVNKSRREENGLEVGLSMPEKLMEAFCSIFSDGLGNF